MNLEKDKVLLVKTSLLQNNEVSYNIQLKEEHQLNKIIKLGTSILGGVIFGSYLN